MQYDFPLVTVIIPVYKVEKYLRKAVQSALAQDYRPLEIILVDDGSPDRCPEICDELAKEHEEILVIHKSNGGLSSARNAGIDISKGDYILFLDSDDALCSGAVSNMMQVALQESADIVIPDRYIKVEEKTGIESLAYHFTKAYYLKNPLEFILKVLIGKGRAWRAHSLLYKSQLIKFHNIRFPEGIVSEDFFFNIEYLPTCSRLAFYPHPTIRYLRRSGSLSTSFKPGYIHTIYRIDSRITEFLAASNIVTEENIRLKNSLFCRNIVTYLTVIMSKSNIMPKSEKQSFVYEMFNDLQFSSLFIKSPSTPYFDSIFAMCYYRVMFFLIFHKLYAPAIFLARVCSGIKARGI